MSQYYSVLQYAGLAFSSVDMGGWEEGCPFGKIYPLLHRPKQSLWLMKLPVHRGVLICQTLLHWCLTSVLTPAVFPRAVMPAASSPDVWNGKWMCLLHSVDSTQSFSHSTGQYYFYWLRLPTNRLSVWSAIWKTTDWQVREFPFWNHETWLEADRTSWVSHVDAHSEGSFPNEPIEIGMGWSCTSQMATFATWIFVS